MGFGLP